MKRQRILLIMGIVLITISSIGCNVSGVSVDSDESNALNPNIEQEDTYLLYVESKVPFIKQSAYSFFVDPYNNAQLDDYYVDISSLIPSNYRSNAKYFSKDGKRVAIRIDDPNDMSSFSYDIYDIQLGKAIATIEAKNSKEIVFSPFLNYYTTYNNNKIYIHSIKDGTSKEIEGRWFVKPVFSPDETKLAFEGYQANDEKSYICIYDIEKSKTMLNKQTDLFIVQWHENGKLILSGESTQFMDIYGNMEKLLDLSVVYGSLSPDSKYFVYSRPISDIDENEEYLEEGKFGLYLIDMKTGKETALPMIKNENNRYDTPFVTDFLDSYTINWFNKPETYTSKRARVIDIINSKIEYKKNVYSSSSLESKDQYAAENVMDGKIETAWVEGVDGQGTNEYIIIEASKFKRDISGVYPEYNTRIDLSGIDIINGYAKSKEAYYTNNRIKKIKIEFSDGTYIEKELADNVMGFQKIEFGKTVSTDYLKITILEVYRGTKFNDTCVSEIVLHE